MIQPDKPLRQPTAHPGHLATQRGMKCGCYVPGETQRTVQCPGCGAAYDWDEFVMFNRWRCYDCGLVDTTGPVTIYDTRVGFGAAVR